MRVFSTLLGLLLLVAPPALAQVDKEVSEVTGTVRLESAEMTTLYVEQYAGNYARSRAGYVKESDSDPVWSITFYGFASDTTEFSAATRVRLQADGQPLAPIRVESNTRPLNGSILEVKRTIIPRSTFEGLATADTARAQVGSARFRLTANLKKRHAVHPQAGRCRAGPLHGQQRGRRRAVETVGPLRAHMSPQ